MGLTQHFLEEKIEEFAEELGVSVQAIYADEALYQTAVFLAQVKLATDLLVLLKNEKSK